jgi:hypothetical protein
LTKGREPLLKGKAHYKLPPCITGFISAAVDIENIIYFFTKQVTLKRWSTVLSLLSQLRSLPKVSRKMLLMHEKLTIKYKKVFAKIFSMLYHQHGLNNRSWLNGATALRIMTVIKATPS